MAETAKNKRLKEAFAIGVTLSRLILAESVAQNISRRKSIVRPLALFLLADEIDGRLARRLGVDTPLRRFADAAVDRISMLRSGVAMAKANPAAKRYLLALAARDAVVGGVNAAHYLRTGEAIQGEGIHAAGTLSIAAFGLVASYGEERSTHLSGQIATAIYGGLATDYVWNLLEPHGEVVDGVRHIKF